MIQTLIFQSIRIIYELNIQNTYIIDIKIQRYIFLTPHNTQKKHKKVVYISMKHLYDYCWKKIGPSRISEEHLFRQLLNHI